MVVVRQLLETMKKKSFRFNLAASAEDEVIESWEEALSAKQEEVWAGTDHLHDRVHNIEF